MKFSFSKRTLKKGSGAGCLILFAVPFAAVGILMLGVTISSFWDYVVMQTWHEVPATIEVVDLASGEDSYKVSARYSYSFEGFTYSAQRVGLHTSSDNVGSWHQHTYNELRRLKGRANGARAYVNPDNPQEAVLDRELRWEKIGFYLIFVLAFGGAGFGLMFVARFGKKKLALTDALKAKYPDQPWLQREDWARGEARSAAGSTLVISLIFAFFWNLISAPLCFVIPEEFADGNKLALIGVIFPVAGIGMIIWAARSLINWRRFGRALLKLETLPGIVGGPLRGRIEVGSNLRPVKGYLLCLNAVRRRTTGSGKNRSTNESILHQESRHIPFEQVGQGMHGSVIPVHFGIPHDAPQCDDLDANDRILWRLEATADIPGVDFSAIFEVPVFETGQSSADYVGPAASQPSGETPGTLLEKAGVILYQTHAGLEIHLPMARHKLSAFSLTVFWAIWTGFIVLMLNLGAPLFFPIVFGLFDLLIFYAVLDLWFLAGRIRVRPGELQQRAGLFGLGRVRSWHSGEIESLMPERGMQSGKKLYYGICLKPAGGRKRSIARRLDSRAQAEALIEQVNAVLGRSHS